VYNEHFINIAFIAVAPVIGMVVGITTFVAATTIFSTFQKIDAENLDKLNLNIEVDDAQKINEIIKEDKHVNTDQIIEEVYMNGNGGNDNQVPNNFMNKIFDYLAEGVDYSINWIKKLLEYLIEVYNSPRETFLTIINGDRINVLRTHIRAMQDMAANNAVNPANMEE